MVSQKDIFISAQLLIKKHGDHAETIAERRMQEMMERDDAKGASVWFSILSSLEDLRAMKQQRQLH